MRLRRRREIVLPEAVDASPTIYTGQQIAAGFWTQYMGPLSQRFAGNVGTVDRCLTLNAQQISAMTLRYRHAETTAGREPSWIHDPDPAWYPNGIKDAIHALVWSIYSRGEAFLFVTSRYDDGYPRTWTLLDPVTMKVEDAGGIRHYESNQVELDPLDVLQIQRDSRGQLRGRSVLEAYWSNIASAYEAESYAAEVYRSTGVNRVALRMNAPKVTQEQARTIQADWVEAVSRRMGAPAVIPKDIELIDSITISPKDLMLLESREWDARQIAAAFGVPAILLNIAMAGSLVYQNPSQLFRLWWQSELMPVAVKVQEALSRWLPRGHWVEFDGSQIQRPDLEATVKTYSTMLADGAVTVDEYRAAVLDLPPLERGDTATEIYEEAGAHGSAGSQPFPDEVAGPREEVAA